MIENNICPYCLNEMQCDHGNHIRWCYKNPNRKIPTEIDDEKFLICYYECSSFSEMMKKLGIKRKPFYRKIKKLNLLRKRRIIDKDVRLKISIKRKEYLKNNPHLHPWKKPGKFTSVPCEHLKNTFKKYNISFVEEYSPMLNDGRFFSIDIAFPDEKIGIEVNGNQHYDSNTGKLAAYYQKRNDLIESKGWTLINLHYTQVYNFNIYNYLRFVGRNYSMYINENKKQIVTE